MNIGVAGIGDTEEYCVCGRNVSGNESDQSDGRVCNLITHGAIIPSEEKCPKCRREEGSIANRILNFFL